LELVLTEQQGILRESAERLVAGSVAARKAGGKHAPPPIDRALWAKIAQAGWLSILVPEDRGGLGLGVTELCLIAEASGRAPLLEPAAEAAAAAGVIADGADPALREALLPRMLCGECIVLPVIDADPPFRTGGARVGNAGERIRFSGAAGAIASASVADGYLVNAAAGTGTVVGYVARENRGVIVRAAAGVDGSSADTLTLDDAEGTLITGPGQAPELIARVYDRLLLAASAGLLGVMEQAHALALDYARVRRQFDRPIGSFQAIQHRAVTDYIAVESTRSLLYQVCAAVDAGHAGPGMASAVKAKSAAAALAVAKSALQIHGAIGYTNELAIGWLLKRAMALAARYGNAAWHRRRFARLSGLGG
jgi:3-oxochol-4-en-24-oyl-CoA dehydrogenase